MSENPGVEVPVTPESVEEAASTANPNTEAVEGVEAAVQPSTEK